MNYKIITFDGLAASGKSTLAKAVAKEMNGIYLSTGELHRINAYVIGEKKINYQDIESLKKYLDSIQVTWDVLGGKIYFYIDGIGMDEVNENGLNHDILTAITRQPFVCTAFTEKFRAIQVNHLLVVDGHGVGNGIFPYADIKFYCDASELVRAARRAEQDHAELEQVMKKMSKRDAGDRKRTINPVQICEDMIVIDTEKNSINECIKIAGKIIETRGDMNEKSSYISDKKN